jgi:hypothetical protein
LSDSILAARIVRPAFMVPHPFRVLRFCIAMGAILGGMSAMPHAYGGDCDPVIAVPGHLGVPVIIDGIDATGAAVYGDWGLARPGHGAILIVGGTPVPHRRRAVHYFPTSAKLPDLGHSEAKAPPAPPPPRSARPAPSTDFHRSWSVGPSPEPIITSPDDQPPPMIVVPPPPPNQRKIAPGTGQP